MTDFSDRRPLYAVALTREGAGLAARIAAAFPETRALAPRRFAEERPGVAGFDEPVSRLVQGLWEHAGGFFLVMAAGIAVRSIAPVLKDKASDPAVVVLDPAGKFAIPILSGHLGGANDLARELGRRLGATPVLTTATDAAGRPAVEVWAREHGLRAETREGVIRINAAWANGEPVGVYVEPLLGGDARGVLQSLEPHLALITEDEDVARAFEGELLALTHRAAPPVAAVLLLRPLCVVLGVGCRRGADPALVENGVRQALAEAELAALSVGVVATVEIKKDEPALKALARSFDAPLSTFSAEVLSAVPVPTPSTRVEQAVGTASVAEAAAVAASGGPLILSKVKGPTWTLAAALRCRPTQRSAFAARSRG